MWAEGEAVKSDVNNALIYLLIIIANTYKAANL